MNARFAVAPMLLTVAALSLVTPQAQSPASSPQSVPDEIIVKFRPGVSDFQRTGVLAGRSARLIRRFRALDLDHVRLNPGQELRATLAALRTSRSVALAQPNYLRRAVGTSPPNDPYWLFGLLWGIERIQAQSVWTNFTHGAADVVVADLDTGVDYNHPISHPTCGSTLVRFRTTGLMTIRMDMSTTFMASTPSMGTAILWTTMATEHIPPELWPQRETTGLGSSGLPGVSHPRVQIPEQFRKRH